MEQRAAVAPGAARIARVGLAALGVLIAALAALAWRVLERGPGFGEDGLTPLAWTCGDGTCDDGLGEDGRTCVRDCADPSARPIGFYAEVSSCSAPAALLRPTSVDEVVAAVREARARGLRVKAKGTGHSLGGNYCSEGVIVALDGLTGISEVEPWRGLQTIVVQPGVRFAALGEALHRAGRSFGPRSTGWGEIGVIGSVLAGSHGTSTSSSSSIHEQLVALTLVDAQGELREYNRFDTDPEIWRALAVSDGALGVVVAARLDTEPDRRLALQVRSERPEDLFTLEGVERVIAGCDYSFILFFPKQDRVVHACAAPTEAPVTDERLTNYLFSPEVPPLRRRLAPGMFQLAATWSPAETLLERVSAEAFRRAAVGVERADGSGVERYVGDAGVGWNHRIVNLPRMGYVVPYFSQIDYEVSLRVADLPALLKEADRAFDAAGRTLPLTGIIVRFDRATTHSLLGANAVRHGVVEGERLAHVELPTYHPYGLGEAALAEYRAPSLAVLRAARDAAPGTWPHLGKNEPTVFREFAQTPAMRAQIERFQRVVDQLDPGGVFANEHLASLGLRWAGAAAPPR